MSAKLTKKIFLQFPKQMLISPHLYSHKPTIEEECSIVVAEHVKHIKKRTREGNLDSMDSPKEDSDDSKMEEESPEKADEVSDVEEKDTSYGCIIGIRYLDGIRSIVKTNT